MGYDVLRDKELNVIPYLKQVVSFFVYKSLIKAWSYADIFLILFSICSGRIYLKRS